ncbi:hypothetical protein L0M92_16325, partial [Casaltella massiliensis]|nr:hypothetical protein [Casaltella massiliensis]
PAKFPSLITIVQKDANQALSPVYRSIFNGFVWGAIFLVVALLLSFVAANALTRRLRELVSVTQDITSGNFA